jgi:hypothetical protein
MTLLLDDNANIYIDGLIFGQKVLLYDNDLHTRLFHTKQITLT